MKTKAREVTIKFDSIRGNRLFEDLVHSVDYVSFEEDCKKHNVKFKKSEDCVDYEFTGTLTGLVKCSVKGRKELNANSKG